MRIAALIDVGKFDGRIRAQALERRVDIRAVQRLLQVQHMHAGVTCRDLAIANRARCASPATSASVVTAWVIFTLCARVIEG
jgi:hypothetical protein